MVRPWIRRSKPRCDLLEFFLAFILKFIALAQCSEDPISGVVLSFSIVDI
jgi:hypothetical protein